MFVDNRDVQLAMDKVECWHVDAIGLKTAKQYRTLHLQAQSYYGWATTFDFQLLATLLPSRNVTNRVIVHQAYTNKYIHLHPLRPESSDSFCVARRTPLSFKEIRDDDIIVVNRGLSHWLPTVFDSGIEAARPIDDSIED